MSIKATEERWKRALKYIEEREELEDIVISGGDAYRLRPEQIRLLGESLLRIPHIRRFRFATKGIAIQPMKILTHHEWTDAITDVVEKGRKLHKEVCIHTHFNHANEVTGISQDALNLLFERGIVVRNQSVFQSGVNDTTEAMTELTRRLSYINVQSYYVYIHDLVRGTEDLRTPLSRALDVEKALRGSTAGFNTPTFVVDAPGGGGKRVAHSFEVYNRETGISAYTAPSVKPGQVFLYFDPARSLSSNIQKDWSDPKKREDMIRDTMDKVKAHQAS